MVIQSQLLLVLFTLKFSQSIGQLIQLSGPSPPACFGRRSNLTCIHTGDLDIYHSFIEWLLDGERLIPDGVNEIQFTTPAKKISILQLNITKEMFEYTVYSYSCYLTPRLRNGSKQVSNPVSVDVPEMPTPINLRTIYTGKTWAMINWDFSDVCFEHKPFLFNISWCLTGEQPTTKWNSLLTKKMDVCIKELQPRYNYYLSITACNGNTCSDSVVSNFTTTGPELLLLPYSTSTCYGLSYTLTCYHPTLNLGKNTSDILWQKDGLRLLPSSFNHTSLNYTTTITIKSEAKVFESISHAASVKSYTCAFQFVNGSSIISNSVTVKFPSFLYLKKESFIYSENGTTISLFWNDLHTCPYHCLNITVTPGSNEDKSNLTRLYFNISTTSKGFVISNISENTTFIIYLSLINCKNIENTVSNTVELNVQTSVMSRKDETNVKAKCNDVPAEDEYWEIQLIVNFTDYFVTIMHMFTSARVDISNVNTVECISTVETHRRGELYFRFRDGAISWNTSYLSSCSPIYKISWQLKESISHNTSTKGNAIVISSLSTATLFMVTIKCEFTCRKESVEYTGLWINGLIGVGITVALLLIALTLLILCFKYRRKRLRSMKSLKMTLSEETKYCTGGTAKSESEEPVNQVLPVQNTSCENSERITLYIKDRDNFDFIDEEMVLTTGLHGKCSNALPIVDDRSTLFHKPDCSEGPSEQLMENNCDSDDKCQCKWQPKENHFDCHVTNIPNKEQLGDCTKYYHGKNMLNKEQVTNDCFDFCGNTALHTRQLMEGSCYSDCADSALSKEPLLADNCHSIGVSYSSTHNNGKLLKCTHETSTLNKNFKESFHEFSILCYNAQKPLKIATSIWILDVMPKDYEVSGMNVFQESGGNWSSQLV